jgi:hypothetical protein
LRHAVRAASEAVSHGRSKIGTRWTHELVAYALERFHRRNLRTPTLRELRATNDELPSYATVRRLYGSAGSMLRFHGYRVRQRGAQPGGECSLERDARGWFLPKRGVGDGLDYTD